MNKETILEKEEFTPDFVIEKISEVIMGADKIRAVFMCVAAEKNGETETVAAAIGTPFELLSLTTNGVPGVATNVATSCVKKLMGKVEVKKDEE